MSWAYKSDIFILPGSAKAAHISSPDGIQQQERSIADFLNGTRYQ